MRTPTHICHHISLLAYTLLTRNLVHSVATICYILKIIAEFSYVIIYIPDGELMLQNDDRVYNWSCAMLLLWSTLHYRNLGFLPSVYHPILHPPLPPSFASVW